MTANQPHFRARHWHGAAHGGPMTHIAYQEADDDGTTIAWDEPVAAQSYTLADEENH